MSKRSAPLPDEIEQFEQELAALREAQHIVLQWLQGIEASHRLGEDLGLLGFSEGMEIALAGMRLQNNPPVEFLQRLISWRQPSGT